MDFSFGGIQQVGLGVSDLEATFRWYGLTFGLDIPAFRDDGEASLMLRYTGGRIRKRRAVLAVSIQGGGGVEIWQDTEGMGMAQDAAPQPGDLGICWVCLKTRDPEAAFECLSRGDVRPLDTIVRDPCGNSSFFVRDPGGNHLRIVPGSGWFARSAAPTGGVSGCAIGVSDIDRARAFYDHAFGYDRVIYDERGTFADLACLPGGHERLRRLMLSRSQAPRGAFADWLGPSQVELVQSLWRTPRGSYAGRHWGDHGFMHLCFEVCGMDGWKERLAHLGFHFTVDSADSFDMGGDLGRFAYVEDPDGTLVELEETHRIGIVKRWGWSLDLRRRPPRKPLPRWMLGMMRFNRVRWT